MEEAAELAQRFVYVSRSCCIKRRACSDRSVWPWFLRRARGRCAFGARWEAAIALSGDLGNIDVAPNLVEAAVSEFGGLDALVANAGIASPGNICDLSVIDWDKMFEVNLRGAWLLAKHCYPHLKQKVEALHASHRRCRDKYLMRDQVHIAHRKRR